MGEQRFTFASKSTPGMTYTVLVLGSSMTCNCPGYTKHRDRKPCTHMKQVAAQLGVEPPKPVAREEQMPSLFGLPTAGFIDPMLASPMKDGLDIDDFTDDPDWVMEEKFDGHRLIVRHDPGGEVVAWSRQGLVRALPRHLRDAISQLAHGTYDGELMVPGGTSTDVKEGTRVNQLVFIAFDILTVGAQHFAAHGESHGVIRRELLEAAFSRLTADAGRVIQVARRYNVSREMLKRIWADGGEGVILKHQRNVYQPGKRSKEWIKLKKLQPGVMTVTGFLPGLLGPHAKIVGVDAAGVEVRVKSLNDAWRAEFAENADTFIGRKLAFEFQDRTREGKYRHPMADHWVEE